MIKQLTALILILALANPLCCCVGKPQQEENSGSSAPLPVPSCCHQTSDDSNSSQDSSNPDDNPPSKNCPCKKPTYLAGAMDLERERAEFLSFTHIVVLYESSPDDLIRFTAPPQTSALCLRPPPPPERQLHIVHCRFRI